MTTTPAPVKPASTPPASPAEPKPRFWGARVLSDGIPQIFLFAWGLMVALPLLWMLMSTFKTNDEIYSTPFALPKSFTLDMFVTAWTKANIGSYFLNTVIVVAFSVAGTLLFSSMVAYVLARYQFRGSRIVFYLFMMGMLFPPLLALVPLVKIAESMGLDGSPFGLIPIYIAFSLPFSVFFLTAFFETLPKELAESAFIDGAGHFRTFFQIMLPLARPGLLSIGIFNFLGQWNQYMLPLVLNPPNPDVEGRNQLLTQGLADLALSEKYESSATSVAEMCAGLLITLIPVLAVYIVFQRKVEEGLTAGALK